MLKRFGLFILVFLFLFQAKGTAALEQKGEEPQLEAIYRWLIAAQHPTGLVSTREGKEGICFTYDQALAVYSFLLFHDVERARKVLEFFKKEYLDQLAKGRFIGYVDMYFSTGATGAVYRAVGPNAWLLNAINEYSYETKDLQFLPIAEALADWIIDLQAIDGGIMGGFHPNLHWISTEHNLDAYCALRNLYYFTKKSLYAQKAEEIKLWLENVAWIAPEKRFGNGKEDPNYALDVSSWAVLALGPQYKDLLNLAEEKCRNKQFYKPGKTEVEGFDFGGPYAGTPFPDKDAVWFEGTGQMAVAYEAVGDQEKADYFLNQMKRCLTPSSYYPNTAGFPYASNPGTPPYGGWQMTDFPLCLSSPAWYLFGEKKFNPFNLGGKWVCDEKELGWPVAGIKPEKHTAKQFVPLVDGFEYTIAQFLTAYPEDGIETTNCIFHRALEFHEKKNGNEALRIVFIPRGISGVQGEFAKSELYDFKDFHTHKLAIEKTSSQPDYSDDEKKKEGSKKEEEIRTPAMEPAQAIMRRKFMAPQNWEGKTSLNLSLFHDSSPNLFFIGAKDTDGHIWLSKEIELDGTGWIDHTLSFEKDFRLLDTQKENQPFSGKNISEMWLGIRTGTPLTESVIFVDDLQLQ